MLRYPTSEIKITAKDVDNAEEIQIQYWKNKKLKRQVEKTNDQPQQQQQQRQQQQQQQQVQQQDQDLGSPSQDSSSSVSFIYDPPAYDDSPLAPEDSPVNSPDYTSAIESSHQQQPKGIKRSSKESESSQRKLSTHDHRARITRQRLGIDQQTPRKR